MVAISCIGFRVSSCEDCTNRGAGTRGKSGEKMTKVKNLSVSNSIPTTSSAHILLDDACLIVHFKKKTKLVIFLTPLESSKRFLRRHSSVSAPNVLLCFRSFRIGSVQNLEHELGSHTHTRLKVRLGGLDMIAEVAAKHRQ